ncbi:MAG: dUTP diphosphatase [Dehalococcoidia bacterium]|nr:dUTP diphosphatase [Dehalococcoidia bacterium]
MEPQEIRVLKLHPQARLPARASAQASGFDLYARLDGALTLTPRPQRVPTGIALETPFGLDVQVRPRSGLTLAGVAVALGTIDADYRGELLVTMWTFGGIDAYELHDGDRVAQLVIARLADVSLVPTEALRASERGAGGHGSTGR